MKTEYVDLETARAAHGLRLVVLANIPSPWSLAAKGVFHLKQIPFVAVRLEPGDKTVREWTRARNAPVAMFENEPARTGWAEILELAERIGKEPSLVPASPSDRVKMFGLAHEVMGEAGLLWSARLVSIDVGLTTDGARGFPPPIAQYLAKRYGYAKDLVPAARKRVDEGLTILREALGSRPYFFGDAPTAIDVYCATAMNLLALPPDDKCPLFPPVRAMFESVKDEVSSVPDELLAHRDRMFERHLGYPIEL
jgi:glutathione S-transferase